MRFLPPDMRILVALGLSTSPVLAAWVPEPTVQTDLIAGLSLLKQTVSLVDGSLKEALAAEGVTTSCGPSRVRVRRDYATLSNAEKLEYTRAVKCLMDSPSQIPEGLAPGAKLRYDDFVAVHINQTKTIHGTGSFLHWHRSYIHAFETALVDECAYANSHTAGLPYWNWAKAARDPINSPYMDGSPFSQGGNGGWAPHSCTRRGSMEMPCLSPVVEGRGGGCVTKGPYAGYMANLSSVNTYFDWPNVKPGPFMGYQPRCMRRDIMPEFSLAWSTEAHLLAYFTNSSLDHIGTWQAELEGAVGLHGVGHFIFGGDPGGDVYTSPNDPLFWLHHSMVDRAWWMWQNQKPLERLFQISGTRSMRNSPPSDPATIEDLLDMSWVTPENGELTAAIKNHVSTVGGPYCYVYM